MPILRTIIQSDRPDDFAVDENRRNDARNAYLRRAVRQAWEIQDDTHPRTGVERIFSKE